MLLALSSIFKAKKVWLGGDPAAELLFDRLITVKLQKVMGAIRGWIES